MRLCFWFFPTGILADSSSKSSLSKALLRMNQGCVFQKDAGFCILLQWQQKLGHVESMHQEEFGNKSLKGCYVPACATKAEIQQNIWADVFLESWLLFSVKCFSLQAQKSIKSQEPSWDLGVSSSIWMCFSCPSAASIQIND